MGDVLIHHGIVGQKWGVRRYQEEDGSLTALGKKRYHGGDEVKRKALAEDRTMLMYKAAGYRLATSKDIRMLAGHEDRYKTANDLYGSIKRETLGELGKYDYDKMAFRVKDLREAGLADTKGISVVTNRTGTGLTDVSVQYRYYTDDAVEPTYYDNIKDLENAIKEKEKKKKKKKVQAQQSNKNKAGDTVNKAVEMAKNVPSSVLNMVNDAIKNGKSIVDSILKKLRR